MKRLALIATLLLTQCGADAPMTELRGIDESGVVASVAADHATMSVDVDGTMRTYELRAELPIVDATGARRTVETLGVGSQVQVRTTISPSGRRSAERITILAGPDAGRPSIIEPPAQD